MAATNPELLKILETKVIESRKEYLQLATRLNSLRPAVRLPPELLLEIFKHCTGIPANSNDDEVPISPEWVRVTHVCHRWRRVALEAPMLWANISVLQYPLGVRAFLARSGTLPLRVGGLARASMPASMKRAWRRVLEQSQRIEWLTIRSQGLVHLDSPVHPFGSFQPGSPNFPSLKCLSITIDEHVVAPLPALFRNVHMHSPLEQLSLSFVEFSSALPLFLPTLKRLTISHYPSHIELASWQTFIGALAKLKGLEVLRTKALPPPLLPLLSPDAMVTDKAALSSLRCLFIDIGFTGLMPATLLRHLDCSPKILTFKIGTTWPVTREIPPLLRNKDNALPFISSALRSTVARMEPIHSAIVALESAWEDSNIVSVRGWSSRNQNGTRLGTADLTVELTNYSVKPVMEQLVRDMPLSDVRFLSVPVRGRRIEAIIEEATCTIAFNQMAKLDTFSTNKQALLRSITVRPGTPPLFPKLKRLQLYDVDFARNAPDAWSDVLRDVLQGREEAGRGLLEVVITNARNFTEEIADIIREFVEILDWDEETEERVESESEWSEGASNIASDNESTGEDSDMDPHI